MSSPRRAIIEVRFGRHAGKKLSLDPGQTVRAGRSNVVELPLHLDDHLSAEHFSLSWDGNRCLLRDLNSAAGTWLQGQQVQEAEVPSGTAIRAGDTVLMVYHEAHTPPRAGAPAPIDETLLTLHALRRTPGLYAILDASRGPRPLQLLREAVDEHRSLYEGIKGQALDHVAPYLVCFRSDSGLLERLVREGWGAGWGVFLSCPRPFKEVRRHLRRFLLAEDDETGERYFFRFYDPRTLRTLMPTFTPRQRQDFFGEIDAFFAEGKAGELCRFPRVPASTYPGPRP